MDDTILAGFDRFTAKSVGPANRIRTRFRSTRGDWGLCELRRASHPPGDQPQRGREAVLQGQLHRQVLQAGSHSQVLEGAAGAYCGRQTGLLRYECILQRSYYNDEYYHTLLLSLATYYDSTCF